MHIQCLGIIQTLHTIYIACKGPLLCVFQHINFSKVRWSEGPQRGAVVQIWSYSRITDCDHWFPISISECPKCSPRHRSGLWHHLFSLLNPEQVTGNIHSKVFNMVFFINRFTHWVSLGAIFKTQIFSDHVVVKFVPIKAHIVANQHWGSNSKNELISKLRIDL